MNNEKILCECGCPKVKSSAKCQDCIDKERGLRECNKCKKTLPYESFGKRHDCYGVSKARGQCRDCENKRERLRFKNNPELSRKVNERKKAKYYENIDETRKKFRVRRLIKLGLNKTDIEEQLKKDKCELCGSTESLCVDHCHNTLKVRGLLCLQCNTAIGSFRDKIDLLEKAICYLKQRSTSNSD